MSAPHPTPAPPPGDGDSALLRSPGRFVRRYFFGIFLGIGTLLTGVIGVFYSVQTRDYLADIESKERFAIRLQEQTIARSFDAIVSDLQFLSRQNELLRSLEPGAGAAQSLERAAAEYLALAAARGLYDQVRYIGADGREAVRVNYNQGAPAVVPREELQDKGNRYYFRDTVRLDRGEIFVSPLDLNVEQGQVEQPLKPMIRFGTPIYDAAGAVRGAVILNYLGAHLLEAIQEAARISPGEIMLVNPEGFWLGHPDPGRTWGFMLPGREKLRFDNSYPQAWSAIAHTQSGQFHDSAGLFTFTTVAPLGTGLWSSSGSADPAGPSARVLGAEDYTWKVISLIPQATLTASSRDLLVNLFALVATLFLLSSVPSWLLAQAILRRKLHRLQLWHSANFDILTGLPNRTLFHDRLQHTVEEAERYRQTFALLYLDLDGFKGVNDGLGHDAGDRLLVEVAARLRNCLRSSDTVARVGGDEFTVLLPHLEHPDQAGGVAAKIGLAMARPFELGGKQWTVGASTGIALYPTDGADAEELIRRADQAMYWAKAAGRNCYRFCPPGPIESGGVPAIGGGALPDDVETKAKR